MTIKTQRGYDCWAASYDYENNPHIVLEHEIVLELLDPLRTDTVLDAACGTGKYTIPIFQVGAQVIGIDISTGMLERARQKLPQLELKRHDLTAPLPFEDASFDKVLCAQALKHIANLRSILAEFVRVLKPAGSLVFSVTHPEMHWDDYHVIGSGVSVDIRSATDMYQHRFSDYFDAIERAPLAINRIVQIPVGPTIRHMLTSESYEKVRGRFQILVLKLRKDHA